jgi:hypothetical protein
MQADEISASSIIVIKPWLFIYASFKTHKQHYDTTYLNFVECIARKPILMLADKRILGVLWYKQVRFFNRLTDG